MEIRNALPEDLNQISELARIVWYASFTSIISRAQIEYMLSLKYTPEKMRADMQDHNAVYLKLEGDGQLMGFASFKPSEEPNLLLLDKIYVHPEQQRKGYGTMLMSQVEKIARDERFEGMILVVNKSNQRAIQAYEKAGFKVMRTETIDIGGGFIIEDHFMMKALTNAPQVNMNTQ
jgi:ribosomal protein S18 acetylase RimI-like enzyme